jgi:hypothetical protein
VSAVGADLVYHQAQGLEYWLTDPAWVRSVCPTSA